MKKDNEPLILTRRESLWLLDLIENPPPPAEKFLAAQARYREVVEHGLPLEKVRQF